MGVILLHLFHFLLLSHPQHLCDQCSSCCLRRDRPASSKDRHQSVASFAFSSLLSVRGFRAASSYLSTGEIKYKGGYGEPVHGQNGLALAPPPGDIGSCELRAAPLLLLLLPGLIYCFNYCHWMLLSVIPCHSSVPTFQSTERGGEWLQSSEWMSPAAGAAASPARHTRSTTVAGGGLFIVIGPSVALVVGVLVPDLHSLMNVIKAEKEFPLLFH